MQLFLDKSTKQFENQIKFLENYIDIKLSNKDDADICLSATAFSDNLKVKRVGKKATIFFSKKSEFFKGLLEIIKNENDDFEMSQTAVFETNGVMIDNSRNAVMTVGSTKLLIAFSALMGFDHIELYLEDTFEANGEPYFGYMRMRYTKTEIRGLNEFAKGFGILLIPCIQTLAHLNQIMRYNRYAKIRDIDDILLIGNDDTYKFIENLISTWRECVDSPVIHIGMDEAHNLGKGKYLDKNGLKNRFEIMCDHLNRVVDICKKYEFKPMMWSDMFFKFIDKDYYGDAKIDENLAKLIPADVALIYWDYYTIKKEDYDKQMKKHICLPSEIGFAGGAWKWNGFLPQIEHSLEVSRNALESAKENGIKTVIVTAWGDDGAECPVFSVLPVLALYGEYGYSETPSDNEISKITKILSGYTLDDYKALALADATKYYERQNYQNNPTKYLLYQDLLMGMFDRHIGVCNRAHFEKCSAKLKSLSGKDSKFNYLFNTAFKLCRVLELKCDMGVRIKNAYDKRDIISLKKISEQEIPLLIKRLDAFHKAFKNQWYSINKTGGFDVQDIRLGGLKARIISAKELLDDYISGNINRIEELDQKRLPFNGNDYLDGKCLAINSWGTTVSPNKL
ncbi:MAG: beta-N-acetylhexosaminidase [Clostridia bacterium]|nr:beta-N-acetylhexosaminidase [Clostridia bacterium]